MILIYARVSTLEQASDDRTSLAAQEKKGRAIADIRGVDQSEVAVYVDKGVPGSIPLSRRPFGAKLLATAEAGDCIVAAKLDRMFRSAADALTTIDALASRKVDLIFADMSSEPVTASGVGKMFFTMLAAFAEFERGRIAERILDGVRGKVARGGYKGGPPPYGYRAVGSGKTSMIEVDPAEQEVISYARQIAADGGTYYRVMKEVNARFRNRNGNPFRQHHIQAMICHG